MKCSRAEPYTLYGIISYGDFGVYTALWFEIYIGEGDLVGVDSYVREIIDIG